MGQAGKKRFGRAGTIFGKALIFRIGCIFLYFVIFILFSDLHDAAGASDFWGSFVRWDGQHYLNIARNGYMNAIEDGQHLFLVFYPLYPWLIRLFYLVLHNYELAGILISLLCYGGGCCFFYFLMEQEYGEGAARHGAALLSLFPFGFYFGMVMTESLYFLVSSAFLYYVRNHRWGGAAFWGFLACLTKVQGILLFLAAFTEICLCEKPFTLLFKGRFTDLWKKSILPLLTTGFMFAGTLIYLGINYYVEGDPFRFMYYQKNHWGNALCLMPRTLGYIFSYVKNEWFSSASMAIWIPELLLFILLAVCIVYGFIKKTRLTYMVYLIAFFVLTYSSTWLISAGRYTLSALPLFMIGGQWMGEHEREGKPVYFIFAVLFTIYWIGNFMWKQVM